MFFKWRPRGQRQKSVACCCQLSSPFLQNFHNSIEHKLKVLSKIATVDFVLKQPGLSWIKVVIYKKYIELYV